MKNCWDINTCSLDKKAACPAWEFKAGDSCWFINGTICSGKIQDNWEDKILICKKCNVLKVHLPDIGKEHEELES